MGCGTSFVKYVLFFFNLAVALLGLAIVGTGVAVLMKWDFIKEVLTEHNLTVAPWVFIAIGAVMFLIAFFGCCGAIRESHCMVVTYAIFVLVVIIVQVALGVLMFTYSATIKEGIINGVSKVYDRRHDEASAKLFDNIQEQFQCCGKSGPQDYGIGVLSLPPSCCTREGTILGTCTPVNSNRVGCAVYLGEFYEKWNSTIAGIAIGVACVEVVGALFALCLANSIRNMDRRSHY